MIEFGPEVNGSWFPWNGAWNGRGGDVYGENGIPDGPERFKDAYRRIEGIFRERGALDVTWVFHIASEASPKEEWNSARYYYPGDEWVDWIGVSVYGRLGGADAAVPFVDIMNRVYPGLCALSASKPIAVLELGVTDGPDKAAWIGDAMRAARQYPRLKAVCWWNKTVRPDGTRSTMEIDSTPESLEAYRTGVSDFVREAVWER
jgi:beta-mannanase